MSVYGFVLVSILAFGNPTKRIHASTVMDSVVVIARAQVGKPYVWGKSSPKKGFDCSGLVQYVMGLVHRPLPRTVKEQVRLGTKVTDALRPGDLIFFGRPARHTGIYVGNGRMVVASSVRGRVVERFVARENVTYIRRLDGH